MRRLCEYPCGLLHAPPQDGFDIAVAADTSGTDLKTIVGSSIEPSSVPNLGPRMLFTSPTSSTSLCSTTSLSYLHFTSPSHPPATPKPGFWRFHSGSWLRSWPKWRHISRRTRRTLCCCLDIYFLDGSIR